MYGMDLIDFYHLLIKIEIMVTGQMFYFVVSFTLFLISCVM